MSKQLNIFNANDLKYNHLLKDFLVILAFNKIVGIFFLLILKSILGQISESIKITKLGFQKFKNFSAKLNLSIGKNWWIVFLNLNFLNIFEELSVDDVTNIWLIFFSFSNFSIKGTILFISPTLAPWNHIRFPFFLFSEKKQNFSLNLEKSSFFLIDELLILLEKIL